MSVHVGYRNISPERLEFQPKRVKFTNCSLFWSHNFFGLDFHFYVNFLLIGIGQLDMMSKKSAHPKI